jgi:hypothetical protein
MMAVPHERLEDLARRVAALGEELGDIAHTVLSEAVSVDDNDLKSHLRLEQQLQKARRALMKAEHLLVTADGTSSDD